MDEAALLAAVNAASTSMRQFTLVQVQEALYELEHVGLLEFVPPPTPAKTARVAAPGEPEQGLYRFGYPAFPLLMRRFHDVAFIKEQTLKLIAN